MGLIAEEESECRRGSSRYRNAANDHAIVIRAYWSFQIVHRDAMEREDKRGGCTTRRAATDHAKPEMSNGTNYAHI